MPEATVAEGVMLLIVTVVAPASACEATVAFWPVGSHNLTPAGISLGTALTDNDVIATPFVKLAVNLRGATGAVEFFDPKVVCVAPAPVFRSICIWPVVALTCQK